MLDFFYKQEVLQFRFFLRPNLVSSFKYFYLNRTDLVLSDRLFLDNTLFFFVLCLRFERPECQKRVEQNCTALATQCHLLFTRLDISFSFHIFSAWMISWPLLIIRIKWNVMSLIGKLKFLWIPSILFFFALLSPVIFNKKINVRIFSLEHVACVRMNVKYTNYLSWSL